LSATPVVLSPDQAGEFGGPSEFNVGDVNGDGYADLLVGENGTLSPNTLIFTGSASGLSPTQYLTFTPRTFGTTSLSDLNGDGFGDIVRDGPTAEYLHLGSASGLQATPFESFVPTAKNGYNVYVVGDVNGDGLEDVALVAAEMTPPSIFVYLA